MEKLFLSLSTSLLRFCERSIDFALGLEGLMISALVLCVRKFVYGLANLPMSDASNARTIYHEH